MYKLHLHRHAADDLNEMLREGGDAATAARRLLALVQELKGLTPKRLGEILLPSGSGHDVHDVNYQRFSLLWRRDANIWRLKALDLERRGIMYRVIYAYVIPTHAFHVLAVVSRKEFDYEPDHPIVKRVMVDYDDLL